MPEQNHIAMKACMGADPDASWICSQLTAFPDLDPGTDVNDRSAGIIERGRQQFDIIAKCDFRLTLDQLRIQNMHVRAKADADRKSVVWGKRASVRVDRGGRRTMKKNNR